MQNTHVVANMLYEARDWLTGCEEEHQACSRVDDPPPTRLLAHGRSPDPTKVFLVETDDKDAAQRDYAILSYVWGTNKVSRSLDHWSDLSSG